jgi:hypothetical protein
VFAFQALAGSSATTGSLSGTIFDAAGSALPGVTVTISGPHLPASRIVATDDGGRYRLPYLPPGDDYRLEASLGDLRLVKTAITVSLGSDAALDLVLRPSLEAEVSVTATPVLIDVRNPTSATNITSEQIEAFPTRRDFQQLAILAPQAVFDRSTLDPAIGGSTHLENDYVIEGMSTRNPMTSASATNLTMDFVEEIQVAVGGLSAEYGRALGGLISVVTKSGGNNFTGSLLTYYNDADWASKKPTSAFRGSQTYDLGHDKRDIGASIGGPAVRDRVWFFAAADPRRDVTPIRLTNATFKIDRNERIIDRERVYAGKITAAIKPAQMVVFSAFGNPKSHGGWLWPAAADPSAALETDYSGSKDLTARYFGSLSDRFAIEATAGRHREHSYIIPDTELGRTVPHQRDAANGQFHHGGLAGDSSSRTLRDALTLRASHFFGPHEIRYGADVERNRYDSDEYEISIVYWGQSFINDKVGFQDMLTYATFDYSGYGTNLTSAAFLQDQWQPFDRLTVSAGMRWEQQKLGSAKGVVIATGQNADGTLIRKQADTFTMGNNWAPRLGISWDVTGQQRARIHASAGRYFLSIPVAINTHAFNGYSYDVQYYYSTTKHTANNWYNPTGSPINSSWIPYATEGAGHVNNYGQLTGPLPIAFDTKLEYQDEFSFGGEYQFGSAWVAGARIMSRELHRPIDDSRITGPGQPDPNLGVDYLLDNVGLGLFSRAFRVPKRSYRAVEATLQRRLSHRWQMTGSFVWARERGEFDGSYDYLNGRGTATETLLVELPRQQTLNYGRMRGDRPFQWKVYASYAFPFGLTVSEGLVYSAGVPVSAVAAPRLLGGFRGVYLTPRGSMGRTPNYHTLDLHADWKVPVMKRYGVALSLIADVFNATDQHDALDVDQDYIYPGMASYAQWIAPANLDQWGNPKFNPNLPASPYWNTPTRYQQPRSMQLGIKLAF